jgi:uncharacterized protein YybS (DUF2232 family)
VNYKTSAMVQSSILAAIAIVFAMISMYVPIVGMFTNFLWAVPIILSGARNGLRWSIMTLVVSGAVIAMIVNPIHAVSLVAVFGILGLALGECMHRKFAPMKALFFGSIASFVALMVSLGIGIYIMGIDPIGMFYSNFDSGLLEAAKFYREQGMDEETIKNMLAQFSEMLRMMKIVMPGAFLVSAPALALVNYQAARIVLKRMGDNYPGFPSFTHWDLPKWTIIPYGISLGLVTYYFKDPTNILYKIGANAQVICSFIFILQGVAIIYWFIEKHQKPKWWKSIVIGLMFMVGFIAQVVLFLGLFDLIVDFRKFRKKASS